MPEIEIFEPDLARLAKQRRVIEQVARDRYRSRLARDVSDLELIQRIVDDKVFSPDQTYELQCLGIVLGDVLAGHADLSWVTVRDEYGTDPALRFKSTSVLAFPLTMISKRVEEGTEVEVRFLYEATLRSVRELEAEGC